jgi:hypothetical protein
MAAAKLKQYWPYAILILLSTPLFFLNIHERHSLGDDFAQYIKEAQNIAAGKPYYLSNYIFNKYNPLYAPPQYPPGFPLLLAPIVKMHGLSFKAMCYFNSVLVAALMCALYAFFRRYAGAVAAICLAVLIGYSGFMVNMKGVILADIPCLLFTTLYITLRNRPRTSYLQLAGLVLCAAAAIQTRSQAVFLLGAEGLFVLVSGVRMLLVQRKLNIKELSFPILIIAGTFLFNLFLDKIVFPTPLNTTRFYNSFLSDAIHGHVLEDGLKYLVYLFSTIVSFFHYDTDEGMGRAIMMVAEGAALVGVILGFVIKVKKRFGVEDAFFMVMCLVVIYYPVRDTRYFLPALPMLYLYCYFAVRTIVPLLVPVDNRIAALSITIVYLVAGMGYLKKVTDDICPGCVPAENDVAAFKFLSQKVKENEIIVFTKPRLLTLFTDKKSINVSWQISPEDNRKVFDTLNVKYMLVVDGLDEDWFKSYLRDVQHPVDSARVANYTLYSLR